MSVQLYKTSLSEVEDYLFCSLLHYWKHVHALPGKTKLNTTLDLPQLSISSALSLWASEEYQGSDIAQLTGNVWATWFEHYKISADAVAMLKLFAERRNAILAQFLNGKIRKPGGSKYIEPRMTRRYKDMMESGGLEALPGRVEEYIRPALGTAPAELTGLGPYRVADAYADSMLMAQRYKAPVSQSIVGVDVPVFFEMHGVAVHSSADLVVLSEEGHRVEIHDYSPQFYFSRKWVAKTPKVIAAAHFRSPEIRLEQVHRVVYRHFMSGFTVERRITRSSRLAMALVMAVRGIEAGFVIPAFFSGLDRCKRCSLSEHCIGEGEDAVEHFYPGLLALGEAVTSGAHSNAFLLDGHATLAQAQHALHVERAANRGSK